MHIRYDLKNKLDFSKFSVQANFFLNKEDCIFSFYLVDFASSFTICKTVEGTFEIQLNLSEITKTNNGESYYQNINHLQDPRFKDLFFIKELHDSNNLIKKCNSKQVIDYICVVVKSLSKLNKLTFAI